ncbi:primosomal protein N' [Xylocopilactobacillus apicola]|uniref:Replication restart protein PriA n=1 Tax=Xylocopilactobacillus apicola TaxID=2932184 RepID=A0AAU9DE74_9LACO|nr:primosomal protein N' [Xylocopilactobacillus apicola]BDR58155.1 primosomal protein N' [Xylocopilactobacillus apicola]
MKIAKILVDVPTRQTDRTFDYLVPAELFVECGMRVVVEFGRRKVTGFVVDFVDSTDFSGRLKEISEVIDDKPVLDQEQLKMAQFLAGQYFTFAVTNLWLMLPGMLKGKTEKYLIVHNLTDESLLPLFSEGTLRYDSKTLSATQQKKIRAALARNELEVVYSQSRVITKKYTEIINSKIALDDIPAEIDKLSKQNKYGQLFWQTVLTEGSPLAVKHLTKEIGIPRRVLTKLAQEGSIELSKVEIYRTPLAASPKKKSQLLTHTKEQSAAIKEIAASFDTDQTFLLEGITGSGKTEIYRALSEKVIKSGKKVIILVPEISLTPQMISFFQASFNDRIAVWHSRLSRGEQYDEWRRIKNNEVDLVLGVRSAIFVPLKDLGLIVVDEEHEKSYRQSENPQYDARELAKWRGNYHSCPVIFGSATPTLTSRAKAERQIYRLIRLDKRVNPNGHLPTVQIVDLRDRNNRSSKIFSEDLKRAMLERFERKEQTILFLNRRGYANFLECRNCGYTFNCPNCDVSLTLHLFEHRLSCHYCGYKCAIPMSCPNCHETDLRSFGDGTEKVEEEIKQLNPEITTIRMDRDTTSRKGSYQKIISQFEHHEADILVGTQSVAKGLNFPEVTLVGVLNADISLNRPEFDASEVTFDLLTQVAGRAGRGQTAGKVIIQTYNPNHYAIKEAKDQNYERFFREEMYLRRLHGYLPYYYTIFIKVTSKEEMLALKTALDLQKLLSENKNEQTQILGPAPYYIKRINNEYTYQLALKYKKDEKMKMTLHEIIDQTQSNNKVKINISNVTC